MPSPPTPLLADADAYLSSCKGHLAENTLAPYRRELHLLAAHLGPSASFDIPAIQAFVDAPGARTAAQRCSVVRGFLRWHPGFLGDPDEIQPPRALGLPRPPLAEDEIDVLWVAAESASPRTRALVAVLLGCGVRSSECAALDWASVDREKIRVAKRRVPLPKRARAAVLALREDNTGAGPIFVTARGHRLSTRSIYDAVSEFGDTAGVPDLTPRALRTACLAQHRRGGRTLDEITRWLGYTSPLLVRRALGELAAEIEACPCGAGCIRCGGTGVTITAPKPYVERVVPRIALARLAGRARELVEIADADAAALASPHRLRALSARLEGGAEQARRLMHEVSAGEEAPRPAHEAIQPRLRAVASEVRKLGQVFLARGWADEAWAEEVESIGCAVELLARQIAGARHGPSPE